MQNLPKVNSIEEMLTDVKEEKSEYKKTEEDIKDNDDGGEYYNKTDLGGISNRMKRNKTLS